MTDHVVGRMASVEDEYTLIETSLADPALLADQARLREVSKRYKDLTPLVECMREYRAKVADAEAAREYMNAASGDDRELWREELAASERAIAELEARVRLLMVPKDPNEGKGVIMEIRGAEGGEEANLFARDLAEMYLAYAAGQRWKVSVLSSSVSDMGGYNDITFEVAGATAWRNLKYEGGPHRVQRVPATESQGRIHTSSATVTVLPEVDEVDVHIDERDLDIDVFRASGPGGQGVNTTDSAVRITHRPSGLVVSMQDERSQLQNRARAMVVLRARLFELAEQERNAELSAERRAQTGGGGRSEKIRTYNYKENRVTDHRIGFTVYRLAAILAGDLQSVIDALAADERARLLAEGGEGALR
jgi:peptide chain release factor 1